MDDTATPSGISVPYQAPTVILDVGLEINAGSPLSFSDPLDVGGIGE